MRNDQRRLQDILECADETASYLEGVDEMEFGMDPMRRRAVERLLTIIAEAAKQLNEETRRSIDQPWREIIRFRDKGIHHYDSLTPARLYRIATQSVPDLGAAVAAYLDS